MKLSCAGYTFNTWFTQKRLTLERSTRTSAR